MLLPSFPADSYSRQTDQLITLNFLFLSHYSIPSLKHVTGFSFVSNHILMFVKMLWQVVHKTLGCVSPKCFDSQSI